MPVWIVLLPDRTGVFTSFSTLWKIVESGHCEAIREVENEVVARRTILKFYSVERAFLLGIEDVNTIQKNYWYILPSDILDTFVETEKMKEQ